MSIHFVFKYRSGNGPVPSMSSNLHLDDEDETIEPCCQEHFALSMAPSYSNKPDWVHVLPIPDLKGYNNKFQI